MTRSALPRLVVPALLVAATAVLAACSSGEATLIPNRSGGGPSLGAQGASSTSSGSSSSSSSSSGSSSGSSGSSSSSSSGGDGEGSSNGGPTGSSSGASSGGTASGGGIPTSDGGLPPGNDAGTGAPPGNPPSPGPLGSCTNPVCGTDLTECGCQATDSAGNVVQLGCEAGGQCACFVNQQLQDPIFDENGACNDEPSTVQQFLANCTSLCN